MGHYRAMGSVILAQTDKIVVVEVSAVLLAMTDLIVDDGLLDSHLDYYGEEQYSEVAEEAVSSATAAQDGHCHSSSSSIAPPLPPPHQKKK